MPSSFPDAAGGEEGAADGWLAAAGALLPAGLCAEAPGDGAADGGGAVEASLVEPGDALPEVDGPVLCGAGAPSSFDAGAADEGGEDGCCVVEACDAPLPDAGLGAVVLDDVVVGWVEEPLEGCDGLVEDGAALCGE